MGPVSAAGRSRATTASKIAWRSASPVVCRLIGSAS